MFLHLYHCFNIIVGANTAWHMGDSGHDDSNRNADSKIAIITM